MSSKMTWVRCDTCDAQLERLAVTVRKAKPDQRYFCGRPKDCFQIFMRQRPSEVVHKMRIAVWRDADPRTRGLAPRSPLAPPLGSPGHAAQVAAAKRAKTARWKATCVRFAKRKIARAQAAAIQPQTAVPPSAPVRFVEDIDPAEDPRFGRRKKQVLADRGAR